MNAWSSGYPIGRPHRTCSVTGRTIEVGESYIAALVEVLPEAGAASGASAGGATVERRDYSMQGWASGRPRGAQEIGHWRSVMPAANAKPKPILDDEALLDLFASTEGAQADATVQGEQDDQGEPGGGGGRAALRLVLALLLIRRRLLAHEGNRGSTMLVRVRGTPRPPEGPAPLEVADPGLDETRIAEVLAELEGLGVSDQAEAGASPVTGVAGTGSAT
jgi:hypothetical protein